MMNAEYERLMASRPSVAVMLAYTLDEQGEPSEQTKRRGNRMFCTRKGRAHTVGYGIRTEHGLFIVWRASTRGAKTHRGWTGNWADMIRPETLARCHCDRPRDIFGLVGRMR